MPAFSMFKELYGIQCVQSRPFWNPDLRLRNSNLNFLHYACRLLCEIYIFRFDLQYSQYIFHSCVSYVTLSFLHRLNQLLLFYRFILFKNCSCLFFLYLNSLCAKNSLCSVVFLINCSLFSLSAWSYLSEQLVAEEQSMFCCSL
jgi:hypothetical protein